MERRCRRHAVRAAALSVLILTLAPLPAARASSRPHHLRPQPGTLAFAYGTGGALMLASVIQIRVNGTVRSVGGAACAVFPQNGRLLDHSQLVHVLHVADKNGFFSFPPVIRSSHPNVDLASRSITIYTTAGKKLVAEAPYATNRPFDLVYRALTRIAPFSFACARSSHATGRRGPVQTSPSLRAVTLHRGRLHAAVLGSGWTPGSIVAIVIHLPHRTGGVRTIARVLRPSARGRIEVGFAEMPCGGVRVVARDSLRRKATLRFDRRCAHPAAAFRHVRTIVGTSSPSPQRVYVDDPSAASSVTVHFGDVVDVWEGGTTPSFTAHGGTPNLGLLAKLPSGPWVGCPAGGCPAATSWVYIALAPGMATIHMTPGCSEQGGCTKRPFDITVQVAP